MVLLLLRAISKQTQTRERRVVRACFVKVKSLASSFRLVLLFVWVGFKSYCDENSEHERFIATTAASSVTSFSLPSFAFVAPPLLRLQGLSGRKVGMAFVSKQRSHLAPKDRIDSGEENFKSPSSNPKSKHYKKPTSNEASAKNHAHGVKDFGMAAQHTTRISRDKAKKDDKTTKSEFGGATPAIKSAYTPVLVGDVKGKRCIIVDDIIDTGGTMLGVINALEEAGAKEIYAYASHGLFSNPDDFLGKLQNSAIKYLLISNSVSHTQMTLPPKVRLLSIAPLLAEAVARSLENRSVRGILDDEKAGSYEDEEASTDGVREMADGSKEKMA